VVYIVFTTDRPRQVTQLALADRGPLGIVVLDVNDLLEDPARTLVMRMARLGVAFATARHTRGAWRRRRRVGGGWFGGVLGMPI
jgi:hypothetical protein